MPEKQAHETPAPQPAGVSISKKRKRKQKLRFEPVKKCAAWSPADIATLRMFWGIVDVDEVAERLSRTPDAAARKARDLGIRAEHGLKGIRPTAASSGYCRSRLKAAIAALKLRPRMIPRTDSRQTKKTGRAGYTEPEWLRVFEWLKQYPDGVPIPTAKSRTAPERWGTGGKPAKCGDCSTTTRPHYARGKCRRCYKRDRARIIRGAAER